MAGYSLGTAYVQIQASARGLVGNLQREMGGPLTASGRKAGDAAGREFSSKFGRATAGLGKKIGVGLAAAAVVAVKFGSDSVKAASNLAEAVGKTNVVFGKNAKNIQKWSKGSAKSFGTSQRAALEAAGTYGNLFKAFGVGDKATAEMSTSLVELAADMASFNNTSIDDALQALQSGLSGETEPLKQFGVALSDVRIKEQALALGLIKTTKEALTPAAKAQAIYALTMKDTALAQGDFARTSDGLANKQRIMAAQFENVKAKLGQALLPAVTAVTAFLAEKFLPAVQRTAEVWMPRLRNAFNAVAEKVREAWPTIQKIAGAVFGAVKAGWDKVLEPTISALLKAARGVVTWVQTNWPTISAVAARVFSAFSAVWSNVLQPAVTAILTAVRGVVNWVRSNWATISATAARVFSAFSSVWSNVLEPAITAVRSALRTVVDFVRNNWSTISTTVFAVFRGVRRAWDTIGSPVVSAIRGAVVGAWAIITSTWSTVAGVFRGAFNAVKKAWDTIGAPIFNTIKRIVDTVKGAIDRAVGAFNKSKSIFAKVFGVGTVTGTWNVPPDSATPRPAAVPTLDVAPAPTARPIVINNNQAPFDLDRAIRQARLAA